jgi:hypothetical protein
VYKLCNNFYWLCCSGRISKITNTDKRYDKLGHDTAVLWGKFLRVIPTWSRNSLRLATGTSYNILVEWWSGMNGCFTGKISFPSDNIKVMRQENYFGCTKWFCQEVFRRYRVNTHQFVITVWMIRERGFRCFFWDPHKTHKYTVWA